MHKGAVRDALPQGKPAPQAKAAAATVICNDFRLIGKESSLLSPFCRRS
jgi:hypothetical protein